MGLEGTLYATMWIGFVWVMTFYRVRDCYEIRRVVCHFDIFYAVRLHWIKPSFVTATTALSIQTSTVLHRCCMFPQVSLYTRI